MFGRRQPKLSELLPFYRQQNRRVISEANAEFPAKFTALSFTFSFGFLAWVHVYFYLNALELESMSVDKE